MKKIIMVCLAVIILAAAAAYAAAESTPADPEAERAEWTVMFYFCGSDLESKYSFASGNLAEIADVVYPDSLTAVSSADPADETETRNKAGKPGKVNVLIETGGSREWHSHVMGMNVSAEALQRWRFNCTSIYEDFNGEWNGIELLETCPPASMADPATLADFIRWSAATCPAEKYALVLWDHGSGALTGIFIDELYAGDVMYLYELKQALLDSGVQLEALVIDACLMANLETAWAVRDSARWMVASEEIVPGRGTAINAWLRELYTHPECDGRQLGRTICDMTQIKYAGEEDVESQSILTWSVIDLTRIEALEEPLDRFFREISETILRSPELAICYAELFADAEEYGDGRQKMRDIASLFYNEDAVRYINRKTRNDIIDALSDIVVYSVHGAGRSEARGLSFCYPANTNSDTLDIYARNCPSAWYLAYLDAMSDWTAPEDVYEKAERLPEFSTIQDLHISVRKTAWNGFPALVIKSFSKVQGVYYRLYYLDPMTEQTVCLGRTDCRSAYDEKSEGEDGVLMYANEPWQWPCIDNVPCSMDLLMQKDTNTGTVHMYGVPVQIESEIRYLRCGRIDYFNETLGREYVVYGVWEEYNYNNQMANRSVTRLTEVAGREYRLIWPLGVPGESAEIRYTPAEATRKMPRSLLIEEQTLPAGTYYLEYEVEDMFMNPHVLERIEYTWDGEKVILPEGFAWEGSVSVK